jgi:hypothetical protein
MSLSRSLALSSLCPPQEAYKKPDPRPPKQTSNNAKPPVVESQDEEEDEEDDDDDEKESEEEDELSLDSDKEFDMPAFGTSLLT